MATKRKIEACHEKSKEVEEEPTDESTKETLEPAKKKGRKNDGQANKKKPTTTATLTKKQFQDAAEGFDVTMDEKTYTMKPTMFKSGSVGWKYSGNAEITVEEKTFFTQCNFLATVIKSKDWDSEEVKEVKEEKNKNDTAEKDKAKFKEMFDKQPEMTHEDFMSKAQNLKLTGFDKEIEIQRKTFNSKNVGWQVATKSEINVADCDLKVQVNLTCTILKSKQWKEK